MIFFTLHVVNISFIFNISFCNNFSKDLNIKTVFKLFGMELYSNIN